MALKAIHLKAVSDLYANAFIEALEQFVVRRGLCAQLRSDNATNFKEADRELRSIFREASDFFKECRPQLRRKRIEWSLIPLLAPHFEGLCEAGIKSTKFHLRRVIGEQILTYEELTTLLCKIKACLNSRPIYALSNDPSDPSLLHRGIF